MPFTVLDGRVKYEARQSKTHDGYFDAVITLAGGDDVTIVALESELSHLKKNAAVTVVRYEEEGAEAQHFLAARPEGSDSAKAVQAARYVGMIAGIFAQLQKQLGEGAPPEVVQGLTSTVFIQLMRS